ncbi:MAG: STAS/SEC14 domain-containing protein [Calditrichaeota bacterium]|nr:STAS/SEC14 domain-containing protein [Calditrichota bacterium]
MYNVFWQEANKIEITLRNHLTQSDMEQVIHQLESLSAMYQEINVLLDAGQVDKYDFRIILENFDFYKRYKNNLKKVALVSDKKFASFLFSQLNKMTDTEFRHFEDEQLEEARKWIFPSRLPG